MAKILVAMVVMALICIADTYNQAADFSGSLGLVPDDWVKDAARQWNPSRGYGNRCLRKRTLHMLIENSVPD